ncbi:aldo/keto reductase [Dictyobacter formicarum]|uniref:NADP-dependent oxidoreductase domain-containing protein n=1 Tax=Dictyobacter formicarum TaxID=2778368 RepID=A0ABQ3VMQ0_9CHLR|nr:aldo/keto reductase [Dictyobacter formicarum]GHO86888.1 hypothetical protein KSZ_48940 [Dictyobacter formicarum]
MSQLTLRESLRQFVPLPENKGEFYYDFLQSGPATALATALRFTLSTPGVHTAIVGTTNPARYAQNAALIAAGNLSDEEYQEIRAIWEQRADQHWLGLE